MFFIPPLNKKNRVRLTTSRVKTPDTKPMAVETNIIVFGPIHSLKNI